MSSRSPVPECLPQDLDGKYKLLGMAILVLLHATRIDRCMVFVVLLVDA